MENKNPKKTIIGIVVSDAMDKSVNVIVERTVLEPRFKKYIRQKKKYMAHDEANTCKIGDTIMMRASRPLSKNKRWRVEKILKSATI